MSAVTRERVEELLADSTTEYNSARAGDDDDAARFWGPMKDALTRLLALEDALKEARPVIEQYARQLSEDHDGNYVWLQWRDDAVKALEALAALGGVK